LAPLIQRAPSEHKNRMNGGDVRRGAGAADARDVVVDAGVAEHGAKLLKDRGSTIGDVTKLHRRLVCGGPIRTGIDRLRLHPCDNPLEATFSGAGFLFLKNKIYATVITCRVQPSTITHTQYVIKTCRKGQKFGDLEI
jgi:hypothetical protein